MKFRYQGYNRAGQAVQGELEAGDQSVVRMMLREQGVSARTIVPVVLSSKADFNLGSLFGGSAKPSLKDFTVFLRQWSTMQGAGMTVIQTLNVLADQTPNAAFGKVLSKMAINVQEGMTLTESLQKNKGVFDKVFINLVSAGENSGTLDKILERLATYYEKIAAIRRKMISASMYPAISLVAVFGIVIALLVFVVPMFQKMYASQGGNLPAPTQALIDVSNYLKNHVLHMIVIIGTIVGSVIYAFKDEEARKKVDPFLLLIPIIGPLLRKSALAQFCRTLGTLTQAGVPILDAFALAAKTSGNFEIEEAAMRVQASVKEGTTISAPLGKEKAIPKMMVSMIAIGEQTGELEKMLIKIAEFYEDEVDALVSGLTSVLEPILILVMGVVVVSIIIPMYLPVFSMGNNVGG
jgi:type IV pilus assembly protein PilC